MTAAAYVIDITLNMLFFRRQIEFISKLETSGQIQKRRLHFFLFYSRRLFLQNIVFIEAGLMTETWIQFRNSRAFRKWKYIPPRVLLQKRPKRKLWFSSKKTFKIAYMFCSWLCKWLSSFGFWSCHLNWVIFVDQTASSWPRIACHSKVIVDMDCICVLKTFWLHQLMYLNSKNTKCTTSRNQGLKAEEVKSGKEMN